MSIRILSSSKIRISATRRRGSPTSRRGRRRRSRCSRPWSFAFRDIEVESLSEVRIDDREFAGSARGRGGFTIVRRQTTEILPSELTLSGVAVSTPGARHASDGDGRVRFRVDPYPYRGIRPIDLLDRLTGEIDLEGELDPEAALAYLSRGWPSLELESGVSQVSVRLRLDHGLLEAGSRLDIPAARQTIRFLGFEARGTARLEARVESALGAPRLRSELTLGDWQLGWQGRASIHGAGSGQWMQRAASTMARSGLKSMITS